MSWITEVERANSIDELSTSQSILGRTGFPEYEMLDVMVAFALKKILNSHIQFLKRIIVEEQRSQKYDRFLRGRQISYMIYEHFRAIGACELVQGLSDLFTKRLQIDDVQDFDVRWDQALLSTDEPLSDKILEGVYKSKLQDSVQLQTIWGFV